MTQSKTRLTAMTAIAAVLAFASPAMAQEVTPAPVTTTPEPVAATPPAADPAPTTTTTVDPLSASPVVETAPAPAPAKARATPRRATRAAPTPVRAAPRPTVAASPAPASPAPVEAIAPLAAPIVAATPPAVAAPAPVQPPEAPPAESASNDLLPLAAAGGLGLLALLGAGLAMRRRKRRAEEAEYVAYDEPAHEEPRVPVAFEEPMREPSIARAPVMAAPVAAAVASQPLDAPANTLPDGFDLSRFGPHVQAAYRGPTEDNPSLSLKNRLRRASAMDQMVRTEGEPIQPAAPRPLAASATARDSGAVVSKLRPAPNAGGFILGGDPARPKPRPVTHH